MHVVRLRRHGCRAFALDWKCDRESGALAWRTGNFDLPAMGLDDRLGDGQPLSGAPRQAETRTATLHLSGSNPMLIAAEAPDAPRQHFTGKIASVEAMRDALRLRLEILSIGA